jgi:predicted Zn-dependent protease
MAMGRFDEAHLEIERAQELEPLSLSIGVSVGLAYYWARDYERALEEFKKVLDLDPEFSLVHVLLGQAYEKLGAHEQAVGALLEAKELDDTPQVRAILSYVYAVSGKETEAREILRELNESPYQAYVPPYFKALTHAGLREADEAFALLEQALSERSGWMVWLKVDPRLDALRDDPRFEQLLTAVGLDAGGVDRETGIQS